MDPKVGYINSWSPRQDRLGWGNDVTTLNVAKRGFLGEVWRSVPRRDFFYGCDGDWVVDHPISRLTCKGPPFLPFSIPSLTFHHLPPSLPWVYLSTTLGRVTFPQQTVHLSACDRGCVSAAQRVASDNPPSCRTGAGVSPQRLRSNKRFQQSRGESQSFFSLLHLVEEPFK